MSRLGVGVMINMLCGNEESVKTFKAVLNKKIQEVKLDPGYNNGDGGLLFTFVDGTRMALYDGGRSCCENRYLHTDDDLTAFAGAVLLDAETRQVADVEGEWGDVHEMQFLIIKTSLGSFTVETHNEHNGYYGGFWVVCEEQGSITID